MTDQTTPEVRTPQPRASMMFVGGWLFAWLGMMADRGNGWSPILFFPIGMVLGVVGEKIIFRPRATTFQRASRRLVLLGIIFLVAMGLARFSTRIDPAALFAREAGFAPPPSVRNLRGWRQWFDGSIHFIAFETDPCTFDKVLAGPGGPFRREDRFFATDHWTPSTPDRNLDRLIILPFFDLSRVELRPMTAPQCWEHSAPPTGTNGYSYDRVIYDPPTGQVFMAHAEH